MLIQEESFSSRERQEAPWFELFRVNGEEYDVQSGMEPGALLLSPHAAGHVQGQDRFNYSLISKIRRELLLTRHPAAGYVALAAGDK